MITDNNQYAIETFSLTKVFGDWWGRAKVIAVDNLDLRIMHNEVYGLLGPNGSGKTTALKMLLNLLYPTKGKALILGAEPGNTKISERIGYLPEDSYLYKYLSARETLNFYGRIFGLSAPVRKERIETLLEMVGLTAMANRPVGTFSKGMARRIGLAQALINDPELLILDEPTSGMDPISTKQMKDLFIKLAQRGKTILLCSHLLADVEDVCDRIGILYGGRMQVEGPVKSLLARSDAKQIDTGPLSKSAQKKIEQIIQQEGHKCRITSQMDKLEEFFIRTVTSAEEQAQPTSGAKSTTEIGGFLAEEDTSNILDKLVTASAEKEKIIIPDSTKTESVRQLPAQPQQDNGLLEKLTKTTIAPAENDTIKQTKTIETQVHGTDEIKRDVLDQLTGGGSADCGLTEKTEPDKAGDAENE